MFYEQDIIVPINQLITPKQHTTLKVSHGVIVKLGVQFPPGCHNMVHCTINRAVHQIFPTNPDGSIKANNHEVSGEVVHFIRRQPYILDIYTWSPGTSYAHTITVRIWMKRLWEYFMFSDKMYHLMQEEGEV